MSINLLWDYAIFTKTLGPQEIEYLVFFARTFDRLALFVEALSLKNLTLFRGTLHSGVDKYVKGLRNIH